MLCHACGSVLGRRVKLEFHDADTDTARTARIVARMSACRSDCHRNNFNRVSDVSARILARMSVSVSVSASWNAIFMRPSFGVAVAVLAFSENVHGRRQ